MNLHLYIAAPLKRMRKAEPLPTVECTQLEAQAWRAGWWQGIAVGFVIGLGAATLAFA